jgi:two-component system sensor histidine kinase CpxA
MTLIVNAAVSIIFWVHDGGVRQARHFEHLPVSVPVSAFILSAGICLFLARYLSTPIRKMVDVRQQLMRDLSHELRSPLARMQIALGLARRPESDLPRQLDRVELEAQRLDHLIDQIMRLSRLDDPAVPRCRERFNLRELIEELVYSATLEAQQKQADVVLAAEEVWVYGDREMLGSAVENVLRNAVHFTRGGTRVRVLVESTGGEVVVRVSDSGPGVPEPDIERIFMPFYRVSAGRAPEDRGHGIGLAITSRVMRHHSGSAVARNNESGGLDVELRFPARADML